MEFFILTLNVIVIGIILNIFINGLKTSIFYINTYRHNLQEKYIILDKINYIIIERTYLLSNIKSMNKFDLNFLYPYSGIAILVSFIKDSLYLGVINTYIIDKQTENERLRKLYKFEKINPNSETETEIDF